jgi:hypothetical protein
MTYRLLTPIQIPDIVDDGVTPPEGFTKLYSHNGKLIVKFSDGSVKELDAVGSLGQRDVIISQSAPDNSLGADGDIWIKYY